MKSVTEIQVSQSYEHTENLKQFKRFVAPVNSQEVSNRGSDEDGKGKFVDFYI